MADPNRPVWGRQVELKGRTKRRHSGLFARQRRVIVHGAASASSQHTDAEQTEQPQPSVATLEDALRSDLLTPLALIAFFVGPIPAPAFLNKLLSVYEVERTLDAASPVLSLICETLEVWVSTAYDVDFADQPVVIATLTVFKRKFPDATTELLERAKKAFDKAQEDVLRAAPVDAGVTSSGSQDSLSSDDGVDMSFGAVDAAELSDHLSYWARRLYDRISPRHLLRYVRTSTFSACLKTIDKHVAELEMWALSTVLNASAADVQHIYDKFVAIADRCCQLHNDFHTASALYTGLMHPVLVHRLRLRPSSRLHAVWDGLAAASDPANGYAAYRQMFAARAAERNIGVPVLARLLEDLQRVYSRDVVDESTAQLDLVRAQQLWQPIESMHLRWCHSLTFHCRPATLAYLTNIGAGLLLLNSDLMVDSLARQLEDELRGGDASFTPVTPPAAPLSITPPLSPSSPRSRPKSLRRSSHHSGSKKQRGSPSSSSSPTSSSGQAAVRRRKKCFGVPLSESCLPDASNPTLVQLPDVVLETLNQLFEEGPRAQGVFRISPLHAALKSAKSAFNKGKLPAAMDVHTASGVLKLFLRELPEPLFPFDFYDVLLYVLQNVDDADLQQRFYALLVLLLPPPNRRIFLGLLPVLRAVADNERVTLMGPQNLATVFAPTLCRSKDNDLMTMVSDASLLNQLFEFIFAHAAHIHATVTDWQTRRSSPVEGCVVVTAAAATFTVDHHATDATDATTCTLSKGVYAFALAQRQPHSAAFQRIETLEGIEGHVPADAVRFVIRAPADVVVVATAVAVASPVPSPVSSPRTNLSGVTGDAALRQGISNLVAAKESGKTAAALLRTTSLFASAASPRYRPIHITQLVESATPAALSRSEPSTERHSQQPATLSTSTPDVVAPDAPTSVASSDTVAPSSPDSHAPAASDAVSAGSNPLPLHNTVARVRLLRESSAMLRRSVSKRDNRTRACTQLVASITQLAEAFSSSRCALLCNALRVDQVLDKSSGNTALHVAAQLGSAAVCEQLLTKNLCLSKTLNAQGESALHLYLANARVDEQNSLGLTLRVLQQLRVGVDGALPTKQGRTIFHYAALCRVPPLVQALGGQPAQLLAVDGAGRVPFELALAEGSAKVVAQLLLPGDWHCEDRLASQALQQLAKHNPNAAMAQYLHDELAVLRNPAQTHLGVPLRAAAHSYLLHEAPPADALILAVLPALFTADAARPPPSPSSSSSSSSSSIDAYRVALYDFQGDRHDVLSFRQGDLITLLSVRSAEWAEGRTRFSARGLFPLPYVRELNADEREKLESLSSPQQQAPDAPARQWLDAVLAKPAVLRDQILVRCFDYGSLDYELSARSSLAPTLQAALSRAPHLHEHAEQVRRAAAAAQQRRQALLASGKSDSDDSGEAVRLLLLSGGAEALLALGCAVASALTARQLWAWCTSTHSAGDETSGDEPVQQALLYEDDLSAFCAHQLLLLPPSDRLARFADWRNLAEACWSGGDYLSAFALYRGLCHQSLEMLADSSKDAGLSAELEAARRRSRDVHALLMQFLGDDGLQVGGALFPVRVLLEALGAILTQEGDKFDYRQRLWNVRKLSALSAVFGRVAKAGELAKASGGVGSAALAALAASVVGYHRRHSTEALCEAATLRGAEQRKLGMRERHRSSIPSVKVLLHPNLVQDLALSFNFRTLIVSHTATPETLETQLRSLVLAAISSEASSSVAVSRYLQSYRLCVVADQLLTADGIRAAVAGQTKLIFAASSSATRPPPPLLQPTAARTATATSKALLGTQLSELCPGDALPAPLTALFDCLQRHVDSSDDRASLLQTLLAVQPLASEHNAAAEAELAGGTFDSAAAAWRLLVTLLSRMPTSLLPPSAQRVLCNVALHAPAEHKTPLILAVLGLTARPERLLLERLLGVVRPLLPASASDDEPSALAYYLLPLISRSGFGSSIAVIPSLLASAFDCMFRHAPLPIAASSALGFAVLPNDEIGMCSCVQGADAQFTSVRAPAQPPVTVPVAAITWLVQDKAKLAELLAARPPPRRTRGTSRAPPPLVRSDEAPADSPAPQLVASQPPPPLRTQSQFFLPVIARNK